MTLSTCDQESHRYGPSETPLRVRFADVDMMGVVHHSAYLHWCEQIRFHFLSAVMGISWSQLAESGFAFPLTECSMKYLRAVVYDDSPIGYARLQIHRKAMFTFHYAIYDAQKAMTPYAVGSTTHCYVRRDRSLLLQPPRLIREAFDRILSEHPGSLIQSGLEQTSGARVIA